LGAGDFGVEGGAGWFEAQGETCSWPCCEEVFYFGAGFRAVVTGEKDFDFVGTDVARAGGAVAGDAVHVAEELVNEGRCRMIKDFLWGTDLLDGTCVHDDHNIGQF
jgi:hypothetical protein